MVLVWYQNIPDFLLNTKAMIEIIPDKTMSLEQQLNACMRFSLYFSIFVFCLKMDVRILYFPLIVGCITFLIYQNKLIEDTDKRELFDKLNIVNDKTINNGKTCFMPTPDNPFMNVSLVDMQEFPSRPGACDLSNIKIKDQVQSILDDKTICDVDDIFQRNSGFRNFYTNPATTVPNNQDQFAKWLYQLPPTCKERTLSCKPKI